MGETSRHCRPHDHEWLVLPNNARSQREASRTTGLDRRSGAYLALFTGRCVVARSIYRRAASHDERRVGANDERINFLSFITGRRLVARSIHRRAAVHDERRVGQGDEQINFSYPLKKAGTTGGALARLA